MFIITKSGVTITAPGTSINCSDGKTYNFMGNSLIGPNGVISMNVQSYEEAVGIVIGLYGGRSI